MNIIKIYTPVFFTKDGTKHYVQTYKYREQDGGVNLWWDEMTEKGYTEIYLYEIKSLIQQISNGDKEPLWDMVYYIRYKGLKK